MSLGKLEVGKEGTYVTGTMGISLLLLTGSPIEIVGPGSGGGDGLERGGIVDG